MTVSEVELFGLVSIRADSVINTHFVKHSCGSPASMLDDVLTFNKALEECLTIQILYVFV